MPRMSLDTILQSSEFPAPPMLVRACGFIMSAFGVALAAVGLWFLYRLWLLDRLAQPVGLAVVAVSGTIAVFCLLVGLRLYLNRPNRYGSLMTPTGWTILGSVFNLVAAAVGLIGVVSGAYALLLGLPLAVVLGLMCFTNASRLRAAAEPVG